MKRKTLLGSVCFVALTLGACQTADVRHDVKENPAPVGQADVNPGTKAGAVEDPRNKNTKLPTLEDLQSKRQTASESDDGSDKEDKLRGPALKEAALSYGARGGLAWATREINATLREQADKLGKIFAFQRLMLRGPDGALVQPPVIVKASDDYELHGKGQNLRVAETVYRIVKNVQFQPEPPRWQSYLIETYEAPDAPPETMLPKNEAEEKIWREQVAKGWEKGVDQAIRAFEMNLRRLERDFSGMVTYRKLLTRGMVSAPLMAEGDLGVTSTEDGDGMRVNDRSLRVTRESDLVTDPREWRSIVEDAKQNLRRKNPAGNGEER